MWRAARGNAWSRAQHWKTGLAQWARVNNEVTLRTRKCETQKKSKRWKITWNLHNRCARLLLVESSLFFFLFSCRSPHTSLFGSFFLSFFLAFASPCRRIRLPNCLNAYIAVFSILISFLYSLISPCYVLLVPSLPPLSSLLIELIVVLANRSCKQITQCIYVFILYIFICAFYYDHHFRFDWAESGWFGAVVAHDWPSYYIWECGHNGCFFDIYMEMMRIRSI